MDKKVDEARKSSVRALDKALRVLEYLSQIEGDVDLGVLQLPETGMDNRCRTTS